MATNNADNISSSGFVAYDGAGTFSGRSLSPGVQNTIAITNGTGSAGNPTFEVTVNNLTNIPNSALANDSVTITAGTGLSGGGAVVLGGTTSVALATPVSSANGGTGVNNGTSTLTLGGNLATSGAFASTFTMTGATGVTFPTSGTLATTSQIPALPLTVANGGTGVGTLTGVLVGSGTSNITGNAVTQHDVLVGGASNAITSVAPSSTSGIPLVSNGASADPSFTTAVVAGGGTGVTSFANTSALLASGTTTTGTLQNIASVATGQVLTSAGTSTLPAWSASPSVTSITLSGGTALSAYAEGTWNPTITNSGSAPTVTYTAQGGTYTKIGNRCTVDIGLTLNSYTAGSGNAQISSLPFTINTSSSNPQGSIMLTQVTVGASVLYYSLKGLTNSTNANIPGYRSASTPLILVAGGVGASAAVFTSTLTFQV